MMILNFLGAAWLWGFARFLVFSDYMAACLFLEM